MNAPTVLPSVIPGWCRWCVTQGVTINDLANGLDLIKGPEGATWVARGYAAVLDAAVNGMGA